MMLRALPLAWAPMKVWVAASKVSQVGKGSPLARVALRINASLASTSMKALAGTAKVKAALAATD